MSDEPRTPLRKPLRLPAFDYTSPGAYFVTTVTHGRDNLFGRIEDDAMVPNRSGLAVAETWRSLPSRFAAVQLDNFVILPNHVHGIVWLSEHGARPERGAASSALAMDGATVPTRGVVMRAFQVAVGIRHKQIVAKVRPTVAARVSRASDS